MKKTVKKVSRTGAVTVQETVFCENDANIKSRAAYVLLCDKLYFQDEDYLSRTESLWKWLDARETFLTRRQNENNGNLKCDYCGKEHLEIGGKRPEDLSYNNRNKNLATVDHIQSLYNEGAKFNEENMCVSCKKCNRAKGSRALEDYLDSLSIETLQKTAQFLIDKAVNSKKIESERENVFKAVKQ